MPDRPVRRGTTWEDLDRVQLDLVELTRSFEVKVAARDETRRRRDLLDGITLQDRERMNADQLVDLGAATIALRAQNDQLEAELVRGRELRGQA